jgi:hypothetical protein
MALGIPAGHLTITLGDFNAQHYKQFTLLDSPQTMIITEIWNLCILFWYRRMNWWL